MRTIDIDLDIKSNVDMQILDRMNKAFINHEPVLSENLMIRSMSKTFTPPNVINLRLECEPMEQEQQDKPGFTPAEIIKQARAKAENAILETCGKEIQRICDAFTYDTGIDIENVNILFEWAEPIGAEPFTYVSGVQLEHG